MKRRITFARNISKDVDLCYTTNRYVARRASIHLSNASISYTTKSTHIPFFLRNYFNGAPTVYSITVNKNLYSQAKQTMKTLDHADYKKLKLNII